MKVIHQSCELAWLQPQGHLDVYNGSELEQQMNAIMPTQPCLWVIDLQHVPSIDSGGLASLVAGFKLARHRQCRLAICNLCPAVRLIFEITQLDHVFEIFESHTDAIATCDLLSDGLPFADPAWAAA